MEINNRLKMSWIVVIAAIDVYKRQFHVLVKPLGVTSLSCGRNAPVKLGVGQLDVSCTLVVLPRGAKSIDSEPLVFSLMEKLTVPSGLSRGLIFTLTDTPEVLIFLG